MLKVTLKSLVSPWAPNNSKFFGSDSSSAIIHSSLASETNFTEILIFKEVKNLFWIDTLKLISSSGFKTVSFCRNDFIKMVTGIGLPHCS